MKKSINHIYLIILLSILSSVAPMGVDTYLPSIPDIKKNSFNVDIHKVELSLSIFNRFFNRSSLWWTYF